MRLRIKSRADLLSGLLFTGIGVGGSVMALDYPLGDLARMGPGMVPLIVSVSLTLIGAALSIQALLVDDDTADLSLPSLRQSIRPVLCVVLGLLAFGMLIVPLGLFLSTVILVLVASRAEPGYSILWAGILALVLAALVVGIFVYGLGLPFRVWP